ncbi:hypothetical protein [Thauera aromatica]|uniref:hypothetical protein n=1 Tax=Thauera aromatica TaxID=59405 RepID=UPI001FFD2D2E|nr:hypothetical protein [Thauera aromatica]MCK2094659.1 hypothetical protein [Thauera aromatica]
MKDLVKNPIGIVALFISLIYSIANLLLGATAKSLTPDERFPIVIFIVLFPVVILGVFYLLVSRHHGKLYAPGDYKDDKSFLRTLSQEERERKLEKEAEEALPTPAVTEATAAPTSPEAQPASAQRMTDIRNELRVIESLVISKFESELNQRAERDVGIGDTGVSFDALFQTNGKLTFLEIKSIRHPGAVSMLLDRVLYNAVVADRFMNSNFKLILAVVYHFDKEELPRVESAWRRRIEKCPAAIEIKFIPRAELDV